MQINVAQLLKEPVGATRKHTVDVILALDDCEYPVKGDVTLTQTGRKVLVQGKLIATADLACGRCLKPFTCTLPLQIEEEYYPTIDINTGVKLPAPDDPGAFKIDEHHILDLSEAIRQYIVMALPMKPLCQEDCAGICPTCGKDLNEGECDCPHETIDPRWAELLKLKKTNRAPAKSETKGRNR